MPWPRRRRGQRGGQTSPPGRPDRGPLLARARRPPAARLPRADPVRRAGCRRRALSGLHEGQAQLREVAPERLQLVGRGHAAASRSTMPAVRRVDRLPGLLAVGVLRARDARCCMDGLVGEHDGRLREQVARSQRAAAAASAARNVVAADRFGSSATGRLQLLAGPLDRLACLAHLFGERLLDRRPLVQARAPAAPRCPPRAYARAGSRNRSRPSVTTSGAASASSARMRSAAGTERAAASRSARPPARNGSPATCSPRCAARADRGAARPRRSSRRLAGRHEKPEGWGSGRRSTRARRLAHRRCAARPCRRPGAGGRTTRSGVCSRIEPVSPQPADEAVVLLPAVEALGDAAAREHAGEGLGARRSRCAAPLVPGRATPIARADRTGPGAGVVQLDRAVGIAARRRGGGSRTCCFCARRRSAEGVLDDAGAGGASMTSCSHHGDQGCVPQAAERVRLWRRPRRAGLADARRAGRAASANDSVVARLAVDLRRDQLARLCSPSGDGVGARLELGEAVDQAVPPRVDDWNSSLDRECEVW